MIRTFKIESDRYLDWTIYFKFIDSKTATAVSTPEGGAMCVEFTGKEMSHKTWVFSGKHGVFDSFVTDFISLHYADWASGSKNLLSANMVETTEE